MNKGPDTQFKDFLFQSLIFFAIPKIKHFPDLQLREPCIRDMNTEHINWPKPKIQILACHLIWVASNLLWRRDTYSRDKTAVWYYTMQSMAFRY